MATDFFHRQDHARRQTRRLVVMFVLVVAVIILAVYLVAAVAIAFYETTHHGARYFEETSRALDAQPILWRPGLFLAVALGTLLVIALASTYKISELSGGGETIALMLGGRPVNPHTIDLAERRLLNVVEEMALASGIPVPPVYVLDGEPGINAFAAGHTPGSATSSAISSTATCG
jgi:Zn-dependent protease with chaperone function